MRPMTGVRAFKPPTRRQLARTIEEALPVLNGHSNNQDAMARELSVHWERIERMDFAFVSFKSMTFWQRVKWLVRGA